MSFSLLHKSIELFDDNLCGLESKKPTKSNKKNKNISKPVDITGHFLNKKGRDAAIKRKPDERDSSAESSIKLLKKLDRNCSSNEYVEEVMKHHKKTLDQKYTSPNPEKKLKKSSEDQSVFTDEDFERLNTEWLKLY